MSESKTVIAFTEYNSYGEGVKKLNGLLGELDAKLIEAFPLETGRYFVCIETREAPSGWLSSQHSVKKWVDVFFHLGEHEPQKELGLSQSTSMLELIQVIEQAWNNDIAVLEFTKPLASPGYLTLTADQSVAIDSVEWVGPLHPEIQRHFS